MRSLAIAVASLVAGFVMTTWWALESSDVVVIETKQADGQIRSTHVWWVEATGQLWLEAGSPSNGWFVDVRENPRTRIRWNGELREYAAMPMPDEVHHEWIRSAIRRKYGFRDRWIDQLVDTSHSVAVRLVPPGLPDATE